MKKEERILTVVSLLFAASVVFVFLNALDVKLGLCGGGCPDCLCDTCPGKVAPCGAVCSCDPACGADEICDGAGSCVSCGDLGSNCGTHNGSCGNIIKCGVGGTEYCAGTLASCECDTGSCVSCVAPNTCVSYVCTPPGCVDTCVSLGYECGTHTICGVAEDCGDCGTCETCNAAGKCKDVTAETGKNCTSDCRDCVAGSCNLVTEANDGGCAGADTYCCSGSCVNPPGNPSEFGGACGIGDCTDGGMAVWACNGSDYKCSSKDDGCGYCLPGDDFRYEYVCNKDGDCSQGTKPSCPKCQTCQDDGATTSCAAAYEGIQDIINPNLCDGASQVCHNGGCCTPKVCGDIGVDECGLGLDDNCGGTIDCYCDKTDASCECSGGSCHSCAGTDANCWCHDGVPGAGGECKNCTTLQVCKVNGAGNSCLGKGIVPPSNPSDVPGDFEQSIMNITNWLAGFIVMLAILAIVYGGLIYISSTGDQEKIAGGKKIITYALLGLIVAGIAYAAVRVVVDVL